MTQAQQMKKKYQIKVPHESSDIVECILHHLGAIYIKYAHPSNFVYTTNLSKSELLQLRVHATDGEFRIYNQLIIT